MLQVLVGLYSTRLWNRITSYNVCYTKLLREIAIHQFPKRQMTWFRGMERRGFTIHWLDASLPNEEKIQNVMQMLT